jgi:hypothetical protein
MENKRCENIRQYVCRSLPGYLESVAKEIGLPPNEDSESVLLWRGQGDADWPLWPGLQVQWQHFPDRIPTIEKRMFAEFTGSARYLLPVPLDNDWDRLSIAQHYGMRTRLLDWTVNPLVALWFAVAERDQKDAAVWAFHPKSNRIADEAMRKQSPFGVTMTRAFRPITHSSRIALQAGWHTVHSFKPGEGLRAIDRLKQHADSLALFRIPATKRRQLLKDLEATGVSATTVFGDLPSLCTSITNRHRSLNQS